MTVGDWTFGSPDLKTGRCWCFITAPQGSASGYRIVEEPAHERGLRVVWMSRPGYGDSSRRRGRSVVDVVPDTAEVLDALGVHTCLVGGGSSGGPHALACAARLDAAQAVLVVSSHAPFDAEGLDYLAGMGEDNLAVYGAALDGEETLREYLEADRERLLGVSVEGFNRGMVVAATRRRPGCAHRRIRRRRHR